MTMRDLLAIIHMFFMRAKAKFKMRFGIWRLSESEISSLEENIQDACRVWNHWHSEKEEGVEITFKCGWF